MPKYEIIDETIFYQGRNVYRIRAVEDFGDIKQGDIGGWIEYEKNLSYEGLSWVGDNAIVYGSARIQDNAKVLDEAVVCSGVTAVDNAVIAGDAYVHGPVRVEGNARIYGTAEIKGEFEDVTHMSGLDEKDREALYKKMGPVCIKDNAHVFGYARVSGFNTTICDDAKVFGAAHIFGGAKIYGRSEICGNISIASLNKYNQRMGHNDEVTAQKISQRKQLIQSLPEKASTVPINRKKSFFEMLKLPLKIEINIGKNGDHYTQGIRSHNSTSGGRSV